MILLSDSTLEADSSSLASLDRSALNRLLAVSEIAGTSRASRSTLNELASELEGALAAFLPTVLGERFAEPIAFSRWKLKTLLISGTTPFQEAQASVLTARSLLQQLLEALPPR